jgi:hypothetical protein
MSSYDCQIHIRGYLLIFMAIVLLILILNISLIFNLTLILTLIHNPATRARGPGDEDVS